MFQSKTNMVQTSEELKEVPVQLRPRWLFLFPFPPQIPLLPP